MSAIRDDFAARRKALETEMAKLAEAEAELDAAEGRESDAAWPSASEWLDEPLADFEWLLGGVLTAGSVSMLAADPGAGKTTLVCQATICLVNGVSCAGIHVSRRWRTLLVAAEGARLPLRNRYQMACRSLGQPERATSWLIQPRDFSDFAVSSQAMERAIRRHRPDLVILDTIGYFAKFDENDAAQWKAGVMAPLRRLVGLYGCAFLLVHHLRKGEAEDLGSRVRGTSAMRGDVDQLLILDAPYGQDDPYRELWVWKNKYGESMRSIPLSYDAASAVFLATDRAQRTRRKRRGEEF